MSNPLTKGVEMKTTAVPTDEPPVIIEVTRRHSSTIDVIRKTSDSRLLGLMDMKLAERVEAQRKNSDAKISINSGIPDEAELDDDQGDEDFVESKGLTSAQAEELLKQWGRNELPEKTIPKWYIFVSQLWAPMPCMIWIAAIIEAGIENFPDMAILLFIQFANATIGYYEITKAGDAVAALKKSLQARAYAKRDGKFQEIEAAVVVPGDLVLLCSGSAIPADCRTNEGQIEVDQAALTGESLPVTMFKHDECKMGSTVVRGETEATVTATGANTFFGKTAALLGGTNEVSNLQKTIVSIVVVLVGISLVMCLIVFIYLSTIADPVEALGFTVVLMVASIPMAIELVTTTTLAVGSKELSHHGAIVTRLAAIEDMAGMAILCSDKTGTLTLNKMVIQDETPVYKDGESQYSLLRYGAMAAKWLEPPKDALDTLTLGAVDMASLDAVEQLSYMPFDPIVKRTEGTIKEIATGKQFRTTKGAPHVILKLVLNGKTNSSLVHSVENDVHRLGQRGIRSLAIAKTNDAGDWEFLGLLTFLDPPRPDTKQTIEDAAIYGVAVKMITGDHLLIAKETARVLGMGDFICSSDGLPMLDEETKKKPDHLSRDYGDQCLAADGFAQVFPEHKYLIVECLRELGYKVGMTGDGVNDAPALKRADVGVAVHGATDAARAAADIVLTEPGLSTIVHGIIISRGIFVRIRNFIIYRIAATLQLLIFFFIAVFWFKPVDYMPADWEHLHGFPDTVAWPNFFHMPVLMLMLITVLNDGTLIAIGYDNVTPSKDPQRWNRRVLFTIASVLAGVALISSLLLLGILLASWWPNSVFMKFGLGGISYGQITTCIYLKVSISDFLTLFSARTGGDWFWSTRPANILLMAGGLALSASTIIACTWPASYPDGIYALGLAYNVPKELALWIWIYCIVWWFIQDACKVITMHYMTKYNVFNINETGKVIIPESTKRYIAENTERIHALASKPGGGH